MRILGIASSLGGTGKTTTSIALASAFQGLGHRTALIDLDVGLGNIERMIGPVHLGPDLLDVIDSTRSLGPESCTDGLLVIPSSRMSDTWALKPQQLQRLLERCEALGLDYIVCDLPPGLDQPLLSMADLADDIVITCPADMPLAYTVSPMLHRLQAGHPRSSQALKLHLLNTRSPSQAGTPAEWRRGAHFPNQERLSLLGTIPEVEASPLQDQGVLTAYSAIATQLVHMHTTNHDKEN